MFKKIRFFLKKNKFQISWLWSDKLHQDSQQVGEIFKNFISIIIPVQKSTKFNSCLNLIPQIILKLITKKMSVSTPNKLKKPKFEKFELDIGDKLFFNYDVPHITKSNFSNTGRSQIYLTYNKKVDGNFRKKYYEEKRLSFPPNNERLKNKKYIYQI